MAATRSSKAKAEQEEPPARPAFYVATADLYTEPVEDRVPVAAFRAGDHVPVDLHDNHPMWQPLLAAPEDAEAASAADDDDQAPNGGGTNASAGTAQGSEE